MRLISGTLRTTQQPWLPVLTDIPPPNIRRKAACDKLLQIVENHPEWPVYQDLFNHPPPRIATRPITSRKPIWSDLFQLTLHTSGEMNGSLSLWPTRTSSLTIPGFNLGRSAWFMLNRFRTGQGRCAANLHKWRMASSDRRQCGGVQTTSHIIESCPLTRLMVICFGFTQLMTSQSRGCRMSQ